MSNYHVPVMLAECLEGLNIRPAGTYVDVTFGGGGHSRAILEKLDKNGKLLGFDQDDDALANVPEDARFTLANHNFRYLKRFLRYHKMLPADGLLADLGISSHQIDVPERGFAHRFDAELDMRMNKEAALTAANIVNEYEVKELSRVLKEYAELKNAWAIANHLVNVRVKGPVETTGQLKTALEKFAPRGQESKFFSQVFQALRIEVNGELDALKEMLEQSTEVLAAGGRLVVMSYHSLEDRLVKNFINSGNFEGELQKDMYGNVERPFKAIGKVITASEEEVLENPRARSAKLRIAERV